jgi:hypothetical protein
MSEDNAATVCSCENHACGRGATAATINTAVDVHVTCPLCLTPVYCSEQCRIIDWAAHACPNAVQVDKVGALVAVPYYFEDVSPLEALADLPSTSSVYQSYLLSHKGTDDRRTQWTQGPLIGANAVMNPRGSLGRGSEPPAELKDEMYMISIWQGDKQVIMAGGTFSDHTIYMGSPNKKADRIARLSRLDKRTGSILFWPDPKDLKNAEFDREGQITVKLVVGKSAAAAVSSLEFEYGPFKDANVFGRLGKALTKNFQLRLKAKLGPSKESGIKYMQSVRVNSRVTGEQVNLTFSVMPGRSKIQLQDVEFLVPTDTIQRKLNANMPSATDLLKSVDMEKEITLFYCDPRNVDHMNGLVMALELLNVQSAHFIGDDASRATDATLQNAAGIIRKYTRAMNDKITADEEVPMEVNAAVYTAVNALNELQEIGVLGFGGDRRRNYLEKLLNASNAEGLVEQAAQKLLARMQKARASKPKFVATARKSAIKKEINDWRSAIAVYQKKVPGATFSKAMELFNQAEDSSAVVE